MCRIRVWITEEVGKGDGGERVSVRLVCLVDFYHSCCLLAV